jgi:lipoyl(octanoyl) transferase
LISLLQLGLIDYSTGQRLQERLVKLRKEGRIGDVLLLLEHTPVITLGRNATRKNIVASPQMLAERGVEVFETDRGGDVTFHGPGQLVGYPIFDLRGFPSAENKRQTLGAIEHVRRIEEALIRSCADFGIEAKRIAKLTGVWTDGTAPASRAEPGHNAAQRRDLVSPSESKAVERKIAAIGVHISRAVTSHGFALNVNPDLSFFDLIIPCGIADKPVTSMARELGHEVEFEAVTQAVSRHFGRVFNSQILWLKSLDALLPEEKVGVPMRPPEEIRRLRQDDDITWA